MNTLLGFLLLAFTIGTFSLQALAQGTPSAIAELQDAQGNIVGNAYLTPTPEGVQIRMRIAGFDSAVTGGQRGEHGFHIHAVGDCTPPDFSSAGGHFNPTNVAHGFLDPAGPHAGDLPNLWIEADGSADYTVTTNLITLSPGERSIFDEDGSALIIHADPDDYLTDPSGASGDRLACGVINPVQ
jgi:Cu-Zn family superoxide dismutase